MNAATQYDNSRDEAWQKTNEARLRANAQRWADDPNSTLFTERWEGYFVAVTREGQRLVLWMLDVRVGNTDWIQSSQDLRDPLLLQSSYTQAMLLSLLWQPCPQKVFLTGLGGGCLATTLHHHLTRSTFVCVEIAQPVVTAATRFFGFQQDDRLTLQIDDARNFLEEDEAKYSLMLLDIFCDQGVTPDQFTQETFFSLCRSRLLEGGLLAMNLGNSDPDFNTVVSALSGLFATLYACRGRGSTTVLFATDRPAFSPEELLVGTRGLEKQFDFGLPLTPWLSRLEQLHLPAHRSGDNNNPATPAGKSNTTP